MAPTFSGQSQAVQDMFRHHYAPGAAQQWQIEAELPSPPVSPPVRGGPPEGYGGGPPVGYDTFWQGEEDRSGGPSNRIAPSTTTSSPATTTSAGGPWASPMPGYWQFEPAGAI